MLNIARVTISGDNRSLVTASPLINPTATPTKNTRTMDPGDPQRPCHDVGKDGHDKADGRAGREVDPGSHDDERLTQGCYSQRQRLFNEVGEVSDRSK